MQYYPASIRNLIKNFAKLPGIGEKTAERLTLHVLESPKKEAEDLSKSIIEVKEKVRCCIRCFGLSDADICGICSNTGRDKTLLCVVEQPGDMVAIEKSGAFQGVYHILHGFLSPMDGIGPDNIKIKELFSRVEKKEVIEIILATSTSMEGDATASYIAEKLTQYPIKVTRIASGVPIGGDLKYVDQVTLKRAMENRHAILL
ncbi:MAG: recombination protein RecR [Desulfobacterales bacterium]|nr:recombination protein RecR [Desulfobacterales bacterium]MBF0395864.1 recombination protein RecR [Desulfobacterales bacterium]